MTMQDAWRGRDLPSVLASIPATLSEDQLRRAVKERWSLKRVPVSERKSFVSSLENVEERAFVMHVMHRIDELSNYPNEEHAQAAWLAMDMLQNYQEWWRPGTTTDRY